MIRKDIFLPIFIFLFFLIVYSITACGYLTSIDQIIMYDTAKNILTKGELSVSEELSGVINTVPGRYGRFYGVYAIGISLFIIPFILLGKFLHNIFAISWALDPVLLFFVSGFNIVVTAMICLYLYKVCRYYKYTHFISAVLCFFYGFGTMAWVYTKGIWSEPLQAMAFLIAFYYMLKLKRGNVVPVIISSIFLGIAIISKYSNIVFLPLYIVLLFLISKSRLRDTVLYLVLISPFILLIFFINYLKFGNVFTYGYDLLPAPLFSAPLLQGLRMLLFSPNKSLFLFSPILVVTVFSILPFVKKHTRSGLFILTFTLAMVLFYSKLRVSGGMCWGPRYLVPVIPFCVIPIGLTLKKPFVCIRLILAVMFFTSFFIQVISTLANFNQYQMLEQQMQMATEEKMPPHIIGQFLMVKHKFLYNNEVYDGAGFNITQRIKIDQSQTLTYRGIDLWYLHLERIKGIDITRPLLAVFLGSTFILLYMILRLSQELDKGAAQP